MHKHRAHRIQHTRHNASRRVVCVALCVLVCVQCARAYSGVFTLAPLPPPALMRRTTSRTHAHPTTACDPATLRHDTNITATTNPLRLLCASD